MYERHTGGGYTSQIFLTMWQPKGFLLIHAFKWSIKNKWFLNINKPISNNLYTISESGTEM